MRLPYEKYTRFLITCGLNHKEACDAIAELNLPPPTTAEWEALYTAFAECNLPKETINFCLHGGKKVPKDLYRHMRDIGLLEAWLYNAGKNDDFQQAVNAAKNPDLSDKIRALILKKAGHEEIASVARISEKAAHLFAEFFWSTEGLFKRDWVEFWHRLPNDADRKFYLDVFRGSADEVRLMLGLPTRISYLTSLQELHVSAMSRYRQYARDRNPESDKMAIHWSKVALAAGDRHEKNRTKDISDFGKELQFAFDFVESEFPTMDDVVGGKTN